MKTILLLLFILPVILFWLFPAESVFAQTESKDGFINYTVGNQWKYQSRDAGEEFTIKINECTQADTLTTCTAENFGELIVQNDSVFVTDYFSDAGASGGVGVIKYYLANQPVDSVWDACWDCFGYGSEAGIFDTTNYDVFGESVTVKHIGIKEFLGEDDTIGNPVVQLEIAEKFGIISIQFFHGDALVLTGAVIEGEEYGDLIVSNEQTDTIEEVTDFSLSEPYPNPFNPDVSFELTVAHPEEVRIQVFDVLGRLVLAIPFQAYSIGMHRLHLNTQELQTGVFYIVAESSSHREVHSITKIK